jgi:hypothetical protein
MNAERELERRSSAVTLSDMEIFVFPELMYALLLANLMSPRIWRWRDDPWFEGLDGMKPYRRMVRLKQYIMDQYVFNLDLDTWGLTRKQRELDRFRGFINEETLRQSNALFGYEGDKYYFDIDIRTHFGLDKYEGDTIPYWKTETVEAMDAFRHKAGFSTGAGECVSLSVLYAAALFIVARIPLADLYLMATPLHSQNYVDVGDGVLTNNRRLVTRAMWYNGTALSAQARRALENERVTVVAHESGWVHTLYPEATMDRRRYQHFGRALREFLKAPLTDELLGNFLRHRRDLQRCFQLRWPLRGVAHYLPLERAFEYEEGCSYLVTDRTREKLMGEVETEEFQSAPLPSRIVLNDLEAFVRDQKGDLRRAEDAERLRLQFGGGCLNAHLALDGLIRFCHVDPRLPDAASKTFVGAGAPLGITGQMQRADVIARLESVRRENPVADLAFYAYRDLNRTEAAPFLRAALQRCPVSIEGARATADDDLVATVRAWPEESIYDEEGRLAQPDEVWNYRRGDGVEKALLLANILHARAPRDALRVEVGPDRAVLHRAGREDAFASRKGLRPQVWSAPS